jgi:hypothetical protein
MVSKGIWLFLSARCKKTLHVIECGWSAHVKIWIPFDCVKNLFTQSCIGINIDVKNLPLPWKKSIEFKCVVPDSSADNLPFAVRNYKCDGKAEHGKCKLYKWDVGGSQCVSNKVPRWLERPFTHWTNYRSVLEPTTQICSWWLVLGLVITRHWEIFHTCMNLIVRPTSRQVSMWCTKVILTKTRISSQGWVDSLHFGKLMLTVTQWEHAKPITSKHLNPSYSESVIVITRLCFPLKRNTMV